MSKRFLTLVLAAALVLTAMIPMAMAEDDTPAKGSGYYYVYTENGKGLNVRKTPGGEKVGVLKYGARIYVEAFTDETWALITYRYNQPGYGTGDYAAFVNRRYLTKKKPPAKPAGTANKTSTAPAADPLAEINDEFKSAKDVEPYKISVRPTRVSGWVNMRWAPSKSAELLATYKANDQLLVIKELKNWLQVEDPDTGDVGFVSKSFVAQ